MANTRLCLGVEVPGGKEHAARHGLPGLWSLLDAQPRTCWPAFVRGDCGCGNELLLGECEARGLPCFFKLRHTAKVKTLLAQMQRTGAAWSDAGEGWEVIEARLRLSGWSRERRVVLVRETPAIAPVGEHARRRRDTLHPALPGSGEWSTSLAPWAARIAVLVTTLDEIAYPVVALARLYRERADAENVYDELKNQWGWCGYTTQKLAPSRLMANLIALIYNWWPPLRAALRRRPSPRSHHQPPRTAPRSGPAHAQRWPAHRQSQREARKKRPHHHGHHHGHHPGQQHLGPLPLHRGAMDPRATLDAPPDPHRPSLAGWKMARPSPTRSRTPALRIIPSYSTANPSSKSAHLLSGLFPHSRF